MLFRLARRKARQIEKKYLSYLHWSWPRTVAQLLRKGSSTLEQAEEQQAEMQLVKSAAGTGVGGGGALVGSHHAELHAPTGWVAPADAHEAPPDGLELDWVYGCRGHDTHGSIGWTARARALVTLCPWIRGHWRVSGAGFSIIGRLQHPMCQVVR